MFTVSEQWNCPVTKQRLRVTSPYLNLKLETIYIISGMTKFTKCLKLRIYVLFKHEYKTEEYLKMYLPRSHRSFLDQLRSGILPLKIESGRFQNIRDSNTGKILKSKPRERICTLCDLNLVEDEIHFVCICSKYCTLSEELFNTVSQKCASFTVILL